MKFPVNFPVSRESRPETGPLRTASTTKAAIHYYGCDRVTGASYRESWSILKTRRGHLK
jgi:hypothetical protein